MGTTVGVLGATEPVGRRLVELLAAHPTFEVTTVTAGTSQDHTGIQYQNAVTWSYPTPLPDRIASLEVLKPDPLVVPSDIDLFVSALPAATATVVELALAERGQVVCSTAASDRLATDVPLVVPEINPAHLALLEVQRDDRRWDGGLIKTPCAPATVVSLPLAALSEYGLEQTTVSTLQCLDSSRESETSAMDTLNNIIPKIAGEASRIETETRKVLGTLEGSEIHTHDVQISASCNRVPIEEGILVNLWVTTDADVPSVAVESALRDYSAVNLPSAQGKPLEVFFSSERPQPRLDTAIRDGQAVAVGPVEATVNGFKFDCLTHSTIRGAAGTCLLNAELAIDRGYL